jgi:hypothetical protein
MAKQIKNVIIRSASILEIQEAAQPGDFIDLKDLNQVDASFIDALIRNNKDAEYEKFLAKEKELWNQTEETNRALANTAHQKDLSDAQKASATTITDQANTINNLKIQLSEQKGASDQALLVAVTEKGKTLDKQIADLQAKLDVFEAQKKSDITNTELQVTNRFQNQVADLQNRLTTQKLELDDEKTQAIGQRDKQIIDLEHTLEMQKVQAGSDVKEIQQQLDDLKREKSLASVKVLGENLESWCNQEFQNYAISGFENCTWMKDNELVKDDENDAEKKGTKADFIFRCYASSVHETETELTSVCMDMKNEDPNSVNKKKNADYYKKLDSDRTKKNCVYALLVSELEMEGGNVVPVQKVPDYANMYVVRPQYLFAFLGVLVSLARKYQDLLLQMNRDKVEFQDKADILEKFEQLKTTYLEKPLDQLARKIQDLQKNTDDIEISNRKNKDLLAEIVDDTLTNMKDKIDRFDIQKLANKIDKLEA